MDYDHSRNLPLFLSPVVKGRAVFSSVELSVHYKGGHATWGRKGTEVKQMA